MHNTRYGIRHGIRATVVISGFALAFLLGAAPVPAVAADLSVTGLAERGRFLARHWCTSCHVVERDAGRGTDSAPPFPKLADDPAYTEARLRGWLAAPHPPMPDPGLSRREIDEIAAYILSMRRK